MEEDLGFTLPSTTETSEGVVGGKWQQNGCKQAAGPGKAKGVYVYLNQFDYPFPLSLDISTCFIYLFYQSEPVLYTKHVQINTM